MRKAARPLLLGAGIAALGVPQNADAALMLAADITGTPFQAIDNGLNDDDPTLGILSIADQTINGLIIRGSIHSSQKGTVPGTFNILNSSSLEIRNASGALSTARVVIGDTDFTGPASTAFTSGSGTFQTAAGSTIDLFWYDDPLNQQGAENIFDTPGDLIDSFSFAAATPAASFAHNEGPFAVNDPGNFSMTLAFTLNLVNGGALISRGMTELKPVEQTPVPEPAALGLLGVGLAGLALARRRVAR